METSEGTKHAVEWLGRLLLQVEAALEKAQSENDVLRQQLAEAQGGKDEAG